MLSQVTRGRLMDVIDSGLSIKRVGGRLTGDAAPPWVVWPTLGGAALPGPPRWQRQRHRARWAWDRRRNRGGGERSNSRSRRGAKNKGRNIHRAASLYTDGFYWRDHSRGNDSRTTWLNRTDCRVWSFSGHLIWKSRWFKLQLFVFYSYSVE